MTTAQIEGYADQQSLRMADFDIKAELRYNIIPEFMEDVGYVAWRRRFVSTTLTAGLRYIDVPDVTTTFSHLKQVFVAPDYDNPLTFIGEEPRRVLAAIAETTPGKPEAFWLDSDGNFFNRIQFDRIADTNHTIGYAYDIHIKFADAEESVDLDPFIPPQFQWALVDGLKRELYKRRIGVGDQSFAGAAQSFEVWKQRAKKSPELAQKRRYLYAR